MVTKRIKRLIATAERQLDEDGRLNDRTYGACYRAAMSLPDDSAERADLLDLNAQG